MNYPKIPEWNPEELEVIDSRKMDELIWAITDNPLLKVYFRQAREDVFEIERIKNPDLKIERMNRKLIINYLREHLGSGEYENEEAKKSLEIILESAGII